MTELESLANEIYLSSISIAEMMIKASLGKLAIDFDPILLAEESGFQLIDFKAEDAILLKTMPYHHKDPFDRMLIAQAITQNTYIMSCDQRFAAYDCRLIQ